MSDSTRPAKKMKFDLGDFGTVVGVEPVSTKPLWRLDPAVSHPDYKIIVKSISGSRKTEVYNVHKACLSNGKHRSLYFVKLFQSASMKEHKDSQCVIEMDEMAADVFPFVLDFVYSNNDDPITINSKTAVPLRFLANYLSIKSLYDEVNKFIQEDLKVETASLYLKISSIFQDHKVGAAAFTCCPVDDIYGISSDFFQEIASQSNCDSLLLSKRVADYGSNRWENTSQGNVWLKDFLPNVTNETIMPFIDADSALSLLKLAVDANVDADYSQSLVERCIDSLKEEIKYSETNKYEANLQARVEALDDLNLTTQVKVLKEMWQKASLQLQKCSSELQKVTQEARASQLVPDRYYSSFGHR